MLKAELLLLVQLYKVCNTRYSINSTHGYLVRVLQLYVRMHVLNGRISLSLVTLVFFGFTHTQLNDTSVSCEIEDLIEPHVCTAVALMKSRRNAVSEETDRDESEAGLSSKNT